MSDPVTRLLDLHAAGRISDAALDVRDLFGMQAPEEPAGTFHAEFHIVLFDDKGRRAGEYTMRGWADLTPAQNADAHPSSTSGSSP